MNNLDLSPIDADETWWKQQEFAFIALLLIGLAGLALITWGVVALLR